MGMTWGLRPPSSKIRTKGKEPVAHSYRHIPPSQFHEVTNHIYDLLWRGVIEESRSPYASPIIVCSTNTGEIRICIDYRKLNAKTIQDSFLLPWIDESLNTLGGAKYFSAMDPASEFHQVAMDDQDKEKTAFCTPFSLFHYLHMSFGLTNSPATFQHIMQSVFADDIFKIMLVYIDDDLVHSKTLAEHCRKEKKEWKEVPCDCFF